MMAKFKTRLDKNIVLDLIIEADSAEEAREIAWRAHEEMFWDHLEPACVVGEPELVSDEEASHWVSLSDLM